MGLKGPDTLRSFGIWAIVLTALVVPLAAASVSPLLAWRDPIYILAGFAGIVAMAILLLQPLLVGGYLPGFANRRGRVTHQSVGCVLIAAVVIHVAALWVTSPPDVVDALLFVSPTPFSAWGVVAMWAVLAAGFLAMFRRRLRLSPRRWRLAHKALAAVVVVGSVVHALLIEGTMEILTKAMLCALVVAVSVKVFVDLRSRGRKRL